MISNSEASEEEASKEEASEEEASKEDRDELAQIFNIGFSYILVILGFYQVIKV